ncbi:MAG: peptidoglycan DD-metalloendopeptidase family protein [Saprospiraceae bacterium]|nr:peptidoglycan DD-metalloendopeptidase family protein [Saprospiraceae bacterium]
MGAQTKEELEARQANLNKEILLASQLLSQNQEDKKTSLAQITLLRSKIKKQESLSRNIQGQVNLNLEHGKALQQEIVMIEEKLEEMTERFGALLGSAYRQKLKSSKWLYLLSASSFNEMWRRWHYIGRIRQAWASQAEVLSQNRSNLEEKILALDKQVQELRTLREQAKRALADQKSDESRLDKMLKEIQGQEKSLRKELARKESERKKLLKAIEAIISKELANAPENLPNTPLGRISIDFKKSKGELPWPVAKGLVTKYYGNKRHPALPNVTTSNNGIDIRTTAGASVNAIFAGEVVSVTEIPGFDQVVILKHGAFYTVYSYLQKTSVKRGQQIEIGQRIGKARKKDATGEVHLEIWQGKDLQDPLLWLVKK